MQTRPRCTLRQASIRNLLTLRYDPEQKPMMSKLSWKNFTESKILDPEVQVERILKNTINHTMKKLRANKITISLSSGIDSMLVLTLLRECYPSLDIHSLSFGFHDPSDETKIAAQIAEIHGCEHHEIYVDNPFKDLPKQIGIVKEPRWNLYWYHVTKNAKSISDIFFTGDGGDELFAGYTFRYKKFASLTRKKNTWKQRAWAYLECHERDWVPDQEYMFGNKIKFSWMSILDLLEPYFNNRLPSTVQVFLADFNGKLLFDWLPTNSKLYSHFQIHAVAPMLSKEMISFATHIPYELKYNVRKNLGKMPLRNILKKKKLHLVSKKKKGFGPDIILLWKRHGKEMADEYLDQARIIEEGWINQEWVNSAFKRINETADVRYINKMFSLLAFEIWYRIFVTKEMKN